MLPTPRLQGSFALNLHRGLLFSSRHLHSHIFQICFSFVAFNTLLYLGLTLIKLLPRPKPYFLKGPKDPGLRGKGKVR